MPHALPATQPLVH